MQVYRLTGIGDSLAANPVNNPSPALQVLYWIRRNGKQASDERIKSVAPDGEGTIIIQKLLSAKAIKPVG